jgi:hypothetical protein
VKQISAETKEDIWRIPADTNELIVEFQLSLQGAHEIFKRCGELERIIFSGKVYGLMSEDGKDYVGEKFHVEVRGEIGKRRMDPVIEKEIRNKYEGGMVSIEHIAEEYGIDYDVVKKVIEGRY